MKKRIPERADLESLSRDQWEDLCSKICTVVYQTLRVEDRLGKGNGLDGWRFIEAGVHGFQYKRYDERFGQVQVTKLRENINTAYSKVLRELGRPLKKFTIVMNVDLEPGHLGKEGEIERYQKLKKWAFDEFGIDLEVLGVTWVLTNLLLFPYLMPSLFEDIPDTLKKIEEGQITIRSLIESITKFENIEERFKCLLRKIGQEVLIHYERGVKYQDQREFLKAIQSLEDAKRLAESETIDNKLLCTILILLCGIKTLAGYLSDAIEYGEKSALFVADIEDIKLKCFAKGNLAFAYSEAHNFQKAEPLFLSVLNEFEQTGDIHGILMTVAHITQMYVYKRDFQKVLEWAERLLLASEALYMATNTIYDLSLRALGNVGNALLFIGMNTYGEISTEAYDRALSIFLQTENMAKNLNDLQFEMVSMSQQALCLWNMNKIKEADELYPKVISRSSKDFGKIIADAMYNRALIASELHNYVVALELFKKVERLYEEIGDVTSVNDTKKQIVEYEKRVRKSM